MALPILLFSFFILFLFAYACESKKRGFTLHICAGSPINRGGQGVNPPFTGIHKNVTNGVKR